MAFCSSVYLVALTLLINNIKYFKMKKITLLLSAMLLTFAAQSQTLLTQSADPVNVTDGGILLVELTAKTIFTELTILMISVLLAISLFLKFNTVKVLLMMVN